MSDARIFDDIDDTLAYLITQLIQREPFYGHCITGMVRVMDPQLKAAAGVTIMNATVHLLINPKKFMKFGPLGMAAVLKHEVLHLLMNHIPRRDDKQHKVWNIAADAAINQYVRNIPEGSVSAKDLELPPNGSAELYYEMLLKRFEQAMKKAFGEGGPTALDTHEQWADADPAELQNEVVKVMAGDARDLARGNIPGEVQQLLPEIFKVHSVPWNIVLRMFTATLGRMQRSATWKKMNRRFELNPGYRRLPQLNLVVCIDTSGSISDETLGVFFGEIDAIHKDRRNLITIIECDANIGNVYKYEGVPPKEIKGRGGTAFKPALCHADTFYPRPDGIVYLTDGWGDNPEQCTNIPVLWVVTPDGDMERCAQFGRKIKMAQEGRRR